MFIADELCHRVAFIVDGEIKLIDSPRNLKLQYGDKMIEVDYIKDGENINDSFSTILEKDKKKLKEIIDNYEIETMHSKEASLEEIFIKVTGRGLV